MNPPWGWRRSSSAKSCRPLCGSIGKGPPLPGGANARAALRISRYAYVLENGRVVREGESDALLKDPAIIEDYLGGG